MKRDVLCDVNMASLHRNNCDVMLTSHHTLSQKKPHHENTENFF